MYPHVKHTLFWVGTMVGPMPSSPPRRHVALGQGFNEGPCAAEGRSNRRGKRGTEARESREASDWGLALPGLIANGEEEEAPPSGEWPPSAEAPEKRNGSVMCGGKGAATATAALP
jgi:hypothetical protein